MGSTDGGAGTEGTVGVMPDDASLRPFRIDVPNEVLNELHERLARTRWPEAETVDDWSQGAPLSWIQNICGYWADGYDWRARERR